jgi:hypothetical protein
VRWSDIVSDVRFDRVRAGAGCVGFSGNCRRNRETDVNLFYVFVAWLFLCHDSGSLRYHLGICILARQRNLIESSGFLGQRDWETNDLTPIGCLSWGIRSTDRFCVAGRDLLTWKLMDSLWIAPRNRQAQRLHGVRAQFNQAKTGQHWEQFKWKIYCKPIAGIARQFTLRI